MKLNCQVIEDLLPLYIDGVCSGESKLLVEEHLKECELCNNKFKVQSKEIILTDCVINENLKSKKPFKKIKRYQMITIFILLIIMMASITYMNSGYIWHTNGKKYIENREGNPMTVRYETEYTYKGKKYKIIFATPTYTKYALHVQCFEEKFGGLFYKPTYGAGQGGSSYLWGFIKHFTDGSDDGFNIVYGYNDAFKAKSFSVHDYKNNQWITQDISKQDYFLYVYTDIVFPEVILKDDHDNDITNTFYRH